MVIFLICFVSRNVEPKAGCRTSSRQDEGSQALSVRTIRLQWGPIEQAILFEPAYSQSKLSFAGISDDASQRNGVGASQRCDFGAFTAELSWMRSSFFDVTGVEQSVFVFSTEKIPTDEIGSSELADMMADMLRATGSFQGRSCTCLTREW